MIYVRIGSIITAAQVPTLWVRRYYRAGYEILDGRQVWVYTPLPSHPYWSTYQQMGAE